ncbi:phenylalanine--tRNA ligase subunit beta [Paenactinomyces guangxiensis]|uniref:Phenylalanine--tRNA ligase beta subunit n=1 Tax=Paenactinomyces guangxiensis TaxID=1490290 RepID=A0A7W1WR46_9BACL|nr:phenylalanine--tRNA ligase subunit beta [Paenactinomyces guangxiensis]MBA4494544.1 phenylalanine--tRNA ligase subunit beta [Paenactinomyces guangxiensis]MBH8591694.1 phenylalanine--tRNA ligase subunit beta [Paenactinomyces guangxiensis]
MLVSYEWLSQYVDLEGISPEDIGEELNRTGIEVEVIYTRDAGVSGVVVGEVLSVERHPEADRLNVCMVHVGKGQQLQIVCGAANVAKGQRVPVALVGAKLPGGRIKKARIRGVESNGMICSAKELGLPDKVLMKEQTEGILVLGSDAPVGEDVKNYLGMNDQVIELQLTPNRSDCLSMIGVAYEIAAIFDRELRLPDVLIQSVYDDVTPVKITLESEEDCPFYAAQVVHNLKIGPSPQWMQNRLISAGIRPINNIVDVTNYVMIETGQPLHAFDYNQISDGNILVRRAHPGESLVTLDGVTRTCDDETLLITDGKQPLGIAGIMGGESSEVTEKTTSVLIESAFFDPLITRKAARKLGLRSEASNRFEKGVDPERIIPALARAVQLLQQIAGGEVGSDITEERIGEVDDVVISLRHDRLVNLLGVQIEEDEVLDIFRRLNFPVQSNEGVYDVQVPTRRPDLALEVDLIEEVARIFGYDRIPTTLPWGQQPPGGLTREQKLRRITRHMLRNLGMHEAVTYSLTSPEADREIESLHSSAQPIGLANPMSNERAVLRTSLLPHLLEVAAYNVNHGISRVAIFEVGRTYLTEEKKLTALPDERLELGGLFTGGPDSTIWKKKRSPAEDFYTAKGVLEALFARLGVEDVEYREAAPKGFHPGRTAEMVLDGEVIGLLGQLHPKLAQKHDLADCVVFQLDLAKLFDAVNDETAYQPIPRFPAVTRDLAMVVDKDVAVGEVEEGIREVAGELLESVTLFDVFTGAQVGEGKKSIAYSLVYRAMDRTLTDEEVHEIHGHVVNYLEDVLGAKLRQ